jgi:hypothetical protein
MKHDDADRMRTFISWTYNPVTKFHRLCVPRDRARQGRIVMLPAHHARNVAFGRRFCFIAVVYQLDACFERIA